MKVVKYFSGNRMKIEVFKVCYFHVYLIDSNLL